MCMGGVWGLDNHQMDIRVNDVGLAVVKDGRSALWCDGSCLANGLQDLCTARGRDHHIEGGSCTHQRVSTLQKTQNQF